MKIAILTVLVFYSFVAQAQDLIQYYSEIGERLQAKTDSYYWREAAQQGNKWIVKEFYTADNSRKLEAECSEVRPNLIYDGTVFTFGPGGNPISVQECMKGECIYLEYYHESKQMLVNGNATWSYVASTGNEQGVEFRDGKIKKSFSVDAARKDTVYIIAEVQAQYSGGMEAFYRRMNKILVYPLGAQINGKEGKVFVEFIVDKDGRVIDAKAIRGVSRAIDKEAVTKVPQAGLWEPAKVNGRPVKQRLVLPITFRFK